jgi:hypothetical protein
MLGGAIVSLQTGPRAHPAYYLVFHFYLGGTRFKLRRVIACPDAFRGFTQGLQLNAGILTNQDNIILYREDNTVEIAKSNIIRIIKKSYSMGISVLFLLVK